MALTEIWTIGHSNKPIEQFLAMLKAYGIGLLADVRRFPGSRKYPHFNSEQLAGALQKIEIGYQHFPELGGRRAARKDSPNTAWRNDAFRGYADYMGTRDFQEGMERLLRLGTETRTALMCAEALWWQCHRGLISDLLKANGTRVWHILSETKVEEHPFTSAARIIDGKLSYAAPETVLELRLE